jgi:hypothetical protein
VLYQCPDGRPFARKHLPASARPQARGYSLQDRRSGQTAEVDAAGDSVSIAWKEDAAATAQRGLNCRPDAVIDAGFDAAVRLHWPALLRGERITLPFLVPARQRYFPVQVRRIGPVRWQGSTRSPSRSAWTPGTAASRRAWHWSMPAPTAPAGVPRHQQPARSTRAYPQVTVRFIAQLPAPRQRMAAGVGAAAVERCAVTPR